MLLAATAAVSSSIVYYRLWPQRQLHSAVVIGFVRGGFLWGWKLGAFAGIFRCCEQVITSYIFKPLGYFSICHIGMTVYRNKEGVLNVVTGGGVYISFNYYTKNVTVIKERSVRVLAVF